MAACALHGRADVCRFRQVAEHMKQRRDSVEASIQLRLSDIFHAERQPRSDFRRQRAQSSYGEIEHPPASIDAVHRISHPGQLCRVASSPAPHFQERACRGVMSLDYLVNVAGFSLVIFVAVQQIIIGGVSVENRHRITSYSASATRSIWQLLRATPLGT